MRRLLLAAGLIASACSFHKSELDETLEWMDNTYNPHDNISGAYGHGRTAWYTPVTVNGSRTEFMASGEIETFTVKGCDMTLRTEDDKQARRASEIYHTATYRFNLRDIDPSSVKVTAYSHLGGFSCAVYSADDLKNLGMNCDHAEMVFKTRNEAGLIAQEYHTVFPKLEGASHNSDSVGKTNDAFFGFNDVEYAQRFAKASTHAVQLCGGKASPF
jgi:hypothetical protein